MVQSCEKHIKSPQKIKNRTSSLDHYARYRNNICAPQYSLQHLFKIASGT